MSYTATMRRGIKELISKVLDEETSIETYDGKLDKATVEEALIRVTVKRAMDPRARLGMEAHRFLTEYLYGKPVQPTALMVKNFSELDDMSEEELLKKQSEIMRGALNGDFTDSPEDPSRVLEPGERTEIIHGLLEARGDVRSKGGQATAARREEAERVAEEIEQAAIESYVAPEGTDDLLSGIWDL